MEDDPGDRELIQYAFKESGSHLRLCFAQDGDEAERYLAGEGPFKDRNRHPLPQLVLLDINLPKKSGLEVLKWLRAQAALKNLPVIMLSSSRESKDIDAAYTLGANSYLVKNMDIDEMGRVIKGVAQFAELLDRRVGA